MAVMSIWSNEEKIFRRIHFAMVVLFILLAGYIISLNQEYRPVLIALSFLYLLLTFFRHLYISERHSRFWQWVFPYLEGAAIYAICSIDLTGTALIILITWDIALDYNYSYGIVYAIIGYGAYMSIYIINYLHLPLGNILLVFFIAAVQFSLFVGFALLAKQYSIQSRLLKETTVQLHAKMIDMEEMAVLKERNRIALEIHNTVGHQLTTALVQLEATRMLMEQDPEEGKMRLSLIKDQLREGLGEIRKAIHAIQADSDYEDFTAAVERLLAQVKKHAGIIVSYNIDDISEVKLKLKKNLYHIILESVTNAIKHGHCQQVLLDISKQDGIVVISVFNDGTVPKNVKFGYGLSRMQEDIKKMGGSLEVSKNEDGWFGIVAKLPVFFKEGEQNGEN